MGGFIKQLGSTLWNTAKNSSKQGLISGILSASKGSYSNIVGEVGEVGWHNVSFDGLDMSNSTNVPTYDRTYVSALDVSSKFYQSATKKAAYDIHTELSDQLIPSNSGHNLYHTLQLPQWGYDMFINERSSFQKGLGGPTSDPGYFYFKIFFNFNTNYGLFGGILNGSPDNPYEGSVNTAIKYLYMCRKNYKQEQIIDRINALTKFTKILSFINSRSPWFFSGISGLDKANVPIIDKFDQERSIEIECMPDAIDMRINTMLDLYKFAAYDDYFSKEIIPENLRKFDMSVMLFAAPIKYLHTAMKKHNGSGDLDYKKFEPSKYENMPSFKLFTFINCEFDLESLGGALPSSMTNEQPFQIAKNRIKINYDKVVVHEMNEFNRIMFGTTGIYYDEYYQFQSDIGKVKLSATNDMQSKRYKLLSDAAAYGTGSSYQSTQNKFKEVIDASESVAHTNLMKLTGYSLGNLYSYATKVGTDYWREKMNWQFGTNIPLVQDIGTNFLIKLLGSHYNASARLHRSASGTKISDTGWLPGYGEVAIGSKYWEAKLWKLKEHKDINKSYVDWVKSVNNGKQYSFKDTLYNMFRNPQASYVQ